MGLRSFITRFVCSKKVVTNHKTKKRRIFEVDEEVQSVKKVRFWESPLDLSQNETQPEDTNIVHDERQITLREPIAESAVENSGEVVRVFFSFIL